MWLFKDPLHPLFLSFFDSQWSLKRKSTPSHHVLQHVSVTILFAMFLLPSFFQNSSHRTSSLYMCHKFFLPPVDFLASVWFHYDMENQLRAAGGSLSCCNAGAFIHHPLPCCFQPCHSAQQILNGSQLLRGFAFHHQETLQWVCSFPLSWKKLAEG